MLTLPGAFEFANWSLFLLRVMVALIFGASGFNHLKNPRERAKEHWHERALHSLSRVGGNGRSGSAFWSACSLNGPRSD
jgi:hypothetical protein